MHVLILLIQSGAQESAFLVSSSVIPLLLLCETYLDQQGARLLAWKSKGFGGGKEQYEVILPAGSLFFYFLFIFLLHVSFLAFSSSSLILFYTICSISNAFNAFFIYQLLSSRISVGFRFLISLINVAICSLILFQCSLNYHFEFIGHLLNFFITHISNSISVTLQYSVILSLVSGELSFSCCDTVLLWFFMVLAELLLCW